MRHRFFLTVLIWTSFAAAARAADSDVPKELSPEQKRLLYGDQKPAAAAAPAPPAALGDPMLAEPLRELVGRLSAEDRRDFFAKHPGLSQRLGWKEGSSGGKLYSPGEEKELMEKDADFRQRKEQEKADIERHIRPAAAPVPGTAAPGFPPPAAQTPPPLVGEGEGGGTSRAVPAAAPAKPAVDPAKSAEDAEKAIKQMEDKDIDLKME